MASSSDIQSDHKPQSVDDDFALDTDSMPSKTQDYILGLILVLGGLALGISLAGDGISYLSSHTAKWLDLSHCTEDAIGYIAGGVLGGGIVCYIGIRIYRRKPETSFSQEEQRQVNQIPGFTEVTNKTHYYCKVPEGKQYTFTLKSDEKVIVYTKNNRTWYRTFAKGENISNIVFVIQNFGCQQLTPIDESTKLPSVPVKPQSSEGSPAAFDPTFGCQTKLFTILLDNGNTVQVFRIDEENVPGKPKNDCYTINTYENPAREYVIFRSADNTTIYAVFNLSQEDRNALLCTVYFNDLKCQSLEPQPPVPQPQQQPQPQPQLQQNVSQSDPLVPHRFIKYGKKSIPVLYASQEEVNKLLQGKPLEPNYYHYFKYNGTFCLVRNIGNNFEMITGLEYQEQVEIRKMWCDHGYKTDSAIQSYNLGNNANEVTHKRKLLKELECSKFITEEFLDQLLIAQNQWVFFEYNNTIIAIRNYMGNYEGVEGLTAENIGNLKGNHKEENWDNVKNKELKDSQIPQGSSFKFLRDRNMKKVIYGSPT